MSDQSQRGPFSEVSLDHLARLRLTEDRVPIGDEMTTFMSHPTDCGCVLCARIVQELGLEDGMDF